MTGETTANRADQELLTRSRGGDADALTELYERHGPGLFAYLLRFVGDETLAEEILQDTLLAIWRSERVPRVNGSIRAWLFALARRQALARLPGQRLHVVHLAESERDAPPPLGPDEIALASMDTPRLAAAVGHLGPLQREVLGLAFINEMSLPELAEVLGVPIEIVKIRLATARSALALFARVDREVVA
jgi:RNA polymerase sigma-70 factor (ECF subfamily)